MLNSQMRSVLLASMVALAAPLRLLVTDRPKKLKKAMLTMLPMVVTCTPERHPSRLAAGSLQYVPESLQWGPADLQLPRCPDLSKGSRQAVQRHAIGPRDQCQDGQCRTRYEETPEALQAHTKQGWNPAHKQAHTPSTWQYTARALQVRLMKLPASVR